MVRDEIVEKGAVIFATRDFEPLGFREILEQHKIVDVDRIIPPSLHVGGWGNLCGHRSPAKTVMDELDKHDDA